MTSDVFGVSLTYLPSLIRFLIRATTAYLVKSDLCSLTYPPRNLTSYVRTNASGGGTAVNAGG